MLDTLRYLMRPNDDWALILDKNDEQWTLQENVEGYWFVRWRLSMTMLTTIDPERIQPLIIRNLRRFYGAQG